MSCPNYNFSGDPVDQEVSGLTEPVTIQQLKDYMRLESWSGETSESTEFNFDDDLIGELNTSARQFIEQIANVSLIPHVYEVVLTNMGGIELPRSPIDEVTSIVDSNGDTVDTDNIKVRGNNKKFLNAPTGYDLTVTYTTSALKDSRPLVDIKRIVAAMYDNRGMDINEVVKELNLMIGSYSRKSPIA